MSKTAVVIDYTNHRGERARRPIEPERILFGATSWHPQEQWLLEAFDVVRGEKRLFALDHVHAWQPPKEATIDASIAKQLQASIERNARMVGRLKKLRGAFAYNVDVDSAIDAILKDEEPTWWSGLSATCSTGG